MSAPSCRSRSPIRSLLEAVGLTLLAFAISIVAGVAFLVPTISLGYNLEATWVLIGGTATGQVGFFAVAYGFVRRRDVAVPVLVPSLADVGYLVAGVVAALVAATGLSYVLVFLDLVPESVIGEAATADPTFLLTLASYLSMTAAWNVESEPRDADGVEGAEADNGEHREDPEGRRSRRAARCRRSSATWCCTAT